MNLEADEWTSDISNITSVLKLWLRELPDPLFTTSQHADFMEAARRCLSFLRVLYSHLLLGMLSSNLLSSVVVTFNIQPITIVELTMQGTRTSGQGTSDCMSASMRSPIRTIQHSSTSWATSTSQSSPHLSYCPFLRCDPRLLTSSPCVPLLNRVVQHEAQNQMSVQNLAIVFGPTLFGQGQPGLNGAMNGMADASLQNKVREIIGIALEHLR